jgi:copper(I)-binding protein
LRLSSRSDSTAKFAATLCHVTADISVPNCLSNQSTLHNREIPSPMRLRMLIELLAALILTFAAIAAISQMAKAAGITVENAYARASIGAVKSGAVYLTIINETDRPDRLLRAASDVAGRAAVHVHLMDNDVMTMDEVTCLIIPARNKIAFAPGGLHVMLLDLTSPLKEGGEISLRLTFAHAGEIAIDVPVKSATAGSQDPRIDVRLQLCD